MKLVKKRVVVVPSDLGAVSVSTQILTDFDIEAVVEAKAESQALLIQMANQGRDMKSKTYEDNSMTSVFTTEREDLDE